MHTDIGAVDGIVQDKEWAVLEQFYTFDNNSKRAVQQHLDRIPHEDVASILHTPFDYAPAPIYWALNKELELFKMNQRIALYMAAFHVTLNHGIASKCNLSRIIEMLRGIVQRFPL